ncbi:hypothetical protein NQ317_005349, partial [Molorchus minor]
WALRLFSKAIRNSLTLSDLYETTKSNKSENLANKLERNWKTEIEIAKLKNYKPSLLKVICKSFLWVYMGCGIMVFIYIVILRTSQPVVLALLINLFGLTADKHSYIMMYTYGSILVMVTLLSVIFNAHSYYWQCVVGMRIRIAVSSLIYRKIMRLSCLSLSKTTAGQVVNLLSNDVSRFDLVIPFLHYLWILPFQTVLVTYFIWQQVGIACLSGVVAMTIFTLPLQGYLGSLTGDLRLKVANKTDNRVKLMNEIISGIQVIKMYAWEKPFEKIIDCVRNSELKNLRTSSYLRGFYSSAMVFVERASLCITLICFVLWGNVITPDKTFSLVQFFNLLQLAMAIYYPAAITAGAETLVSIKRLQEFLLLEEKDQTYIEGHNNKEIRLENVSASWIPESTVLSDINIHISPNSLVAIVGSVGSGKSSLLKVLLGEVPPTSGKISIGGEISYASQEPCMCPEKDFEQLFDGDQTVVGERGISLSGGQRARINLARAVYRQTDIYLFDDPLSAVDTHVGKHLFKECMLKYLGGKTRILVTHQLQYLKQADLIVVLNEGKIEAQGTFQELSHSNPNFTKMLTVHESKEGTKAKEKELLPVSDNFRRISELSVASGMSTFSDITLTTGDDIPEEESNKQSGFSSLKEYFKASKSPWALFFLVGIMIISQGFCTMVDFWIVFWMQQEGIRHSADVIQNPVVEKIQVFDIHNHTVIPNYHEYNEIPKNTFLNQSISSGIFDDVRVNNIVYRILKSHVAIFSKDIGAIDDVLPKVMLEAIQNLFEECLIEKLFFHVAAKSPVYSHISSSLNGMTTIRASKAENMLKKEFDSHQDVHTSTWHILLTCNTAFSLWLDIVCVAFVACVIYSFIIIYTVSTVDSSLVGLAISQSLILTGMLQFGMRQTAEAATQFTSVQRVAEYTTIQPEGTFETPTELCPTASWPDRGLIEFRNLSLIYTGNDNPVLNKLNFTVQSGEKVSNTIVKSLSQRQMKSCAPGQGRDKKKNHCLRNQLTESHNRFTAPFWPTIGIVGRTGAGKSSLIAALFRLAPLKGSILIDSVDTQELGLTDLRKKIAIIPQEPVLFSGTLRDNLDPFNEFDDEKLWKTLEEVELKNIVKNLDSEVSDCGGHFSLGQRQLLCLARALLRENKILVLDEATANVDHRQVTTDAFIQETIRRKFKDRTVLTIAHRLNTIMDSDKVLVMDAGSVVEFDHPHNLLQLPEGHFHKLVLQTESAMYLQLKDVALEAFMQKENEILNTRL